MANKCGLVIYNRPCRKNPREFTPNDVKRIVGYASRDGHGAAKVLAYAAVGLGLGYLICRSARAIRNLLSILGWVKKVAAVMASSTAIKIAIEWIKHSPISKIPRVNIAVALIIALLAAIDGILDAAAEVLEDIVVLEELSATIDDVCTEVQKLIAIGG